MKGRGTSERHADARLPVAPASILDRALAAFEAGSLAGKAPVAAHAPQGAGTAKLAAVIAGIFPMDAGAPSPVLAVRTPIAAAPSEFRGGFYRIDRGALADAGLIVPESGITAQLEEFRLVKRQILQQAEAMRREGGGGAAQRILVTSPLPGEGKSFCAANLALSIAAERDSEVVLVDFDAAKNTVLNMFGLPAGPGLIDALADPAIDILDCVMRTDMPGLSVLPGGHSTSMDNEYLASARAHAVLDALTCGAPNRIVLFDTPPTLAASLPVEVAKLVGQVVLVVLADHTSQGAIEDAVSLLSGCPNLQLLLNAVQFSPSGRRFGTYYQ
ncbi:MAG: capsular biosynthesis protein [Sphingomonadales bacterium]|nr:capsular biosynthesis protein [Sphingomonadales bacterium]